DATNTVDASDIAAVVTGSVDATDVDGDTLSYELVEAVAGFTLNPETGEWSFDPSDEAYAELALGEEAEVVVSVVVSDGNGGTTQQDITLNLVGTNDAPVADATNTVDASDIAAVVTGSVDATDVDGDTLSYELVEAVAGFTLNPETGTWTFDPSDDAYAELALGEEAEVVVSVVVSDGNGSTTQQDITLNLVGTNDAPVADATNTVDASDIAEVVTGSVDATDVDGDTLAYALVEEVAGFTLDAETGEWSFDPSDEAYAELAVGEEAEVVVSVVVSDGNGGTTQQDITLNLVGTNDAPVADATNTVDASDIAELVTGSVDATDVDGDTLAYALVEEVAGFTLNPETGEWSFDPSDDAYAELAVGEEAEVVVSVVVSDGNGGTTQQDITLNLVGTNDAPVADATNNIDVSDIAELVTGSVDATDVDGDTLAYALVEEIAGFTLNPENGTWTFDPSDDAYAELALGEEAEVVVSVVVSDGNGGTTQQDITLNLVGTNDAPVADATNTVDASDIAELVTGSVDATDVDGDTLAYALVEEIAGFTLNPDNGTWTFDPSDDAYAELALGEEAEVVVSVVVSDGNGGTTQQDITLNLVGTNDAPVADATNTVDASDIAELVTGSVDATDVDGDTLAYALVEEVAGFTLNPETGTWTFDPSDDAYAELALGEEAEVVVSVVVSDGNGGTTQQDITLNLVGTNDAPVADATNTVDASDIAAVVTGSVDATDVDGDTLSYELVEEIDGFTLNPETGAWTFDPSDDAYAELAVGEEAEVVVSVVVSDGNGGTTQQDITLNLVGTNDAPVADATNTVDASDIAEVVTGSVDATDVDGDTLSYELVEAVAGFTLNPETGEWSFDPSDEAYAELEAGETAAVLASVLVSDGNGGTVQQDITLNIAGENDAPVAVDDRNTVTTGLVGEYYGTNAQINNIADFRSVVESKEPDATYIAANIDYAIGSGGIATGTNLQEFLGVDSLTINTDPSDYTDGGLHLQGYIYLEAGSYNFKVYADDGYQILVNGEDVASVDHNQAPTTDVFSEFTVTESGYQSIDMVWWDQGGRYVFQPTLSSDGGQTYTVIDESILSSSNQSPLITEMGQAIEISQESLLANDSDANDDSLSIVSLSNATNGYAYITAAGVINFIPSADFSGEGSFDYTITDGNGGYDTATAVIAIEDNSVLPTVTVQVSEQNSYGLWNGFSSASEADYAYENYSNYQNFSNTDNKIYVNQNVNASLNLKAGDDSVDIGEDVNSGGYIDLGGGNNNMIVGGSVYHSIAAGSGNDQLQIGEDLSASINLGGGDNYLVIGGNVNSGASINLAGGNDQVRIGGDVNSAINLGNGTNTLVIGGSVSASVQAGSGDDSISIGGDVNNYINLGSGDNTLQIAGNLYAGIGLGNGSDFIVLEGFKDSDVYVDAGSNGTDSIVLNAYSLEDYQQNKDNIQTKLVGFENIKLSDGFVEGSEEAVFDDYLANGLNIGSGGDSSSYEYDLSLSLDETEATVAATGLTLSLIGIPDSSDVSLMYSGEELTAGSDGTYDISLEEGQTSVDNLILVSNVELTDLEVEVVAISTTNDENAIDGVLEGTDGLDVLVGGLGQNVLFGGDDDAADTLTGGSGSDVFVLNKVSSEDGLDTITDFNAAEDSLDLTSLLVGLEGQPDDNADQDTIAAFIADHVQASQDGTVTVDDERVANFTEEPSSFDANQDGEVNTSDAIRVVYNNIEYSINVDG
ncbi:beta strand repeat-containing protein, partial [Marinomonas dokdonensis]|uniref:beta strand repeat-containing protein n=1 Tax=Marinomonas dokdonensis TaxID=328224 RepID=UPI0040553F2E